VTNLHKQVAKINEKCRLVSNKSFGGKKRTFSLVEISNWDDINKEGGRPTLEQKKKKSKKRAKITTTADESEAKEHVIVLQSLLEGGTLPPNYDDSISTIYKSLENVEEGAEKRKITRKRLESVSSSVSLNEGMGNIHASQLDD
jgi:DNA primase catalytic subunit